MIATFLRRLLWVIMLILVQGLILNRVNVMGYATPMIYIYFLTNFAKGSNRSALLLWGFVIGLLADFFTNTPGIAAASCTLVAFVQPNFLNVFAPRDSADDFHPSLKSMGVGSYFRYLLTLTFIFQSLYYLLEVFSLTHPDDIYINIVGGTLFTVVLMMAIASMRKEK